MDCDWRGSVTANTDSNGNAHAVYTMDAFGNVLEKGTSTGYSAQHATDPQPYHLTTKEYDTTTGLYYFGARWYDPTIGRWLSREPTGIDGPNLYHFCLNDPINWFDPDGERVMRWIDDHILWPLGDVVLGAAHGAGVPFMPEPCGGLQKAGAAIGGVGIWFVPGGNLAKGAQAAKLVKHHMMPKAVLKALPRKVARQVWGKKGRPNKWLIPEDLHKRIHAGAKGGPWNDAWWDRIAGKGGIDKVKPGDLLGWLDEIASQFGL